MRDAELRHRALRSTVSNYLGRFAGLGVWFFLTPVVLMRLGAAGYGLWVLAGAVVGYGSLLDLGIGGAITKYVAEYRARGDVALVRRLVATALLVYTGLGLLITLLTIIAAPAVATLPPLAGLGEAQATRLVLLIGFAIALTLPCITGQAVLEGLQRYDLAALATTASVLFSAAATAIVLLAGGDALAAIAVNIPSTLVGQVVSLACLRRAAPELGFGPGRPSRAMLAVLISFGGPLLVSRIAKRLKTKTDELVVAAFLPIGLVTPYALAHRLSDLAWSLTEQFLKILLPMASQLHADQDHARLRSLYTVGTRLTLAIFVPVSCALVLLARPILNAWVGPPYGDYAWLTAILALASLIDTSQWPSVSIMQGMARHRPLALISLASAVANLALSIALVRPFGLLGVALGSLIPTTVEGLFFVFPYAMRTLGLSPREALRRAFGPAVLPVIPMAVVVLALEALLQPTSLIALLAVAGAGVGVYITAYLLLDVNNVERKLCLDMLRVLIGRLPGRDRRRAASAAQPPPSSAGPEQPSPRHPSVVGGGGHRTERD
jgi:O-antigen/teichoic acid export membrane protein